VNFQIGDTVRVGARVGTITDVGTVLIQYKTNDGGLRVACPWEMVKIPSPPQRVSHPAAVLPWTTGMGEAAEFSSRRPSSLMNGDRGC
jgi:hypothetical protein